MQTIFITGSNRGIGLALVREYVARVDTRVFASCRNPESADDLQALKREYGDSLCIFALDINDSASIESAYEIVSAQTEKIDLLFNNAGIFPRQASDTTFGQLTREAVGHVILTNSVSPLMLTQAFVPLLAQSSNARIVMISSQMGSLTRASGGSYAYRMSKSAMNMSAKLLSQSLSSQGITVITTHPGHVSTDMGGSSAPVRPVDSATGLSRIADSLTKAQSGKFFNYTGEEIPW